MQFVVLFHSKIYLGHLQYDCELACHSHHWARHSAQVLKAALLVQGYHGGSAARVCLWILNLFFAPWWNPRGRRYLTFCGRLSQSGSAADVSQLSESICEGKGDEKGRGERSEHARPAIHTTHAWPGSATLLSQERSANSNSAPAFCSRRRHLRPCASSGPVFWSSVHTQVAIASRQR